MTFSFPFCGEEAPEDNEVIYVSAMKMPDVKGTPNEEESIATKLLQSVKDDYETWESGTKPRPAGLSAKQIKAQWASNPSTKTTQLEQQLETRCLRQGLTMLKNVNGTPAYTCWTLVQSLTASHQTHLSNRHQSNAEEGRSQNPTWCKGQYDNVDI